MEGLVLSNLLLLVVDCLEETLSRRQLLEEEVGRLHLSQDETNCQEDSEPPLNPKARSELRVRHLARLDNLHSVQHQVS